MSNYLYSLRNTKPFKKANCPDCGKREFTLYINNNTMEILADYVGKCDRALKCNYHFTPKQYFEAAGIRTDRSQYRAPEKVETKPVNSIEPDVLIKTLGTYHENKFIQFLVSKFGTARVNEVAAKYFIGTSPYWQGSTIFWQVDRSGRIRTGKIMLYNDQTGKRVKEDGKSKIMWVHTTLKDPNFKLTQCLFGDHLLIDNEKIVGVVESEKTAVIASLCLPEMCWIASGAKDHLTDEMLNSLKGFKVLLYPDLDAYDSWKKKADRHGYQVANILEETATPEERAAGYDLADYLLKIKSDEKCDLDKDKPGEQVSEQVIAEPLKPICTEPFITHMDSCAIPTSKAPDNVAIALKKATNYGEDWNRQIKELENFFESVVLLTGPVKLDRATKITNVPKFIDSQLQMVKHNNGNSNFSAYLHRLYLLKELIETNRLKSNPD